MDQTNIILPFIIDDERGRVDQHFMEAIQPLNAQLKHRQTKEHSNARLMQRGQLQPLQCHQPLLL
ncbi:hypothetical protein UUU_24690 [Klebsiella pneumoniae subsp. pneumoniae DSM 30104 = JCM 1662 = NBRC 14940]|nr:hypothetical protein UUU_24690 [Klebsiella pneumoniae subsp. pneumoniae DSM 30104 = JCM 1662 = NBRC 14940]